MQNFNEERMRFIRTVYSLREASNHQKVRPPSDKVKDKVFHITSAALNGCRMVIYVYLKRALFCGLAKP